MNVSSIRRVGNSAAPSAARTYHQLRERRICELLGQWISGLDPMIFERIDVSPQILVEVGVGAPGFDEPMLTAQVTVDDLVAAGGLY
ncbi:hypothetical protein [Sphingomonas sp. Leaf343]|uniref:hypothetical protein n=1 Tax=Sphingomonas sp. Leaf343 TaxID=1736345 RepID=UPI0006F9CF49|nr:hypothetical protein [Sphingomonas sp. Leaf343]KQR83484.1 hypothetical protein ASG07_07085 [Sphingomonas sp. Leaf343]